MVRKLSYFFREELGASMVEYGVALLVVTAIGTGLVITLGQEVFAMVQGTCTEINDGTSC